MHSPSTDVLDEERSALWQVIDGVDSGPTVRTQRSA